MAEVQCPYNRDHLIKSDNLLIHIHSCKSAQGWLDTIYYCKAFPKNIIVNPIKKELHIKRCGVCKSFEKKQKKENLTKDSQIDTVKKLLVSEVEKISIVNMTSNTESEKSKTSDFKENLSKNSNAFSLNF